MPLMGKQATIDRVEERRAELETLAGELWENPELGLQEEESAERIVHTLEDRGFRVETGVGGMPTAFVGEIGTGSPCVGILGEYDALPGLSQEVSAVREPVENGRPGHGCGHNLLGTAGVGAVLALAEAIEAGTLEGTLRFYGCPAEEQLVGKVYMARDGAFDDLDAALTWHPSDLTRPTRDRSLALDSIVYRFEGESAHAAASPEAGRSALDAVQLLNTGVEYLREHVPEAARVHYSIQDGGDAPNVVPPSASVWYYVRSPERSQVEAISDWLDDIAEGAAIMTQTEVSRQYLTGCYDYRPNGTITDVITKNLHEVEPVAFAEEDRSFAEALQASLDPGEIDSSLEKLTDEDRAAVDGHAVYANPVEATNAGEAGGGSTDVGDVSWITPTGQFRATTYPVGTPGHTWQAVAANGSFGVKGMVFAAKVLAASAYDLLADPQLLGEAAAEFARTGNDYECSVPGGIEPPFDVWEQ